MRASWASSSAMPISRMTRAIAAMSRVDSSFHTASIVLWTSRMLIWLRRSGARILQPLLNVLWEVGHLVNLADFDRLVVRHRRPLCPFNGLFA